MIPSATGARNCMTYVKTGSAAWAALVAPGAVRADDGKDQHEDKRE